MSNTRERLELRKKLEVYEDNAKKLNLNELDEAMSELGLYIEKLENELEEVEENEDEKTIIELEKTLEFNEALFGVLFNLRQRIKKQPIKEESKKEEPKKVSKKSTNKGKTSEAQREANKRYREKQKAMMSIAQIMKEYGAVSGKLKKAKRDLKYEETQTSTAKKIDYIHELKNLIEELSEEYKKWGKLYKNAVEKKEPSSKQERKTREQIKPVKKHKTHDNKLSTEERKLRKKEANKAYYLSNKNKD